jgi:hypothetical protein
MNCDATQPTVEFTVTRTACCSFEFNLDIDIPCPTLTVTSATIAVAPGAPTISFVIVKCPGEDGCTFDFELDITIPTVCPTSLCKKGIGTLFYIPLFQREPFPKNRKDHRGLIFAFVYSRKRLDLLLKQLPMQGNALALR